MCGGDGQRALQASICPRAPGAAGQLDWHEQRRKCGLTVRTRKEPGLAHHERCGTTKKERRRRKQRSSCPGTTSSLCLSALVPISSIRPTGQSCISGARGRQHTTILKGKEAGTAISPKIFAALISFSFSSPHRTPPPVPIPMPFTPHTVLPP